MRTKQQWKEWAEAALIRAVRTFAESMLAYIGTGALGFILAMLLALKGLPELDE